MADNIVQKITGSTGELLSYLKEIQGDLSEAKAFINLMGWDLPPGLQDIGLAALDLGNFIEKLDAVAGASNEVWEDEIAMIGRVADLAVAVNDLVNKILILADELPAKLSGFGDYVDRTNIHKELPRRLFDFLLTNYLARTSPLSYAVLHLVNIIDYPHFDADPVNFQVEHIRATVNYHHFKTLFTDPGKLAEEAYGWNTPDYDPTILLQRIQLLFQALAMRSRIQPLNTQAEEIWTNTTVTETIPMPQLITFLFEERGTIAGLRVGLSIFGVRPTTAGAGDGGIGMVPIVQGQLQGSIPLSRFGDTFLDFYGKADLIKSLAISLRPNHDLEVSTASSFTEAVAGRFAIGFRYGSPESERKALLSFISGAKIQFQSLSIAGGMEKTTAKPAQSFMELNLVGCALTVSLSEADGFIKNSISQNKIEGSFDLKIGWSSTAGIYFEGSGGLEISFPTHIQLGVFHIDSLQLGLKTGEEQLALEASATGGMDLGPLKATVDRIGLNVDLSFGSGNLGFFGLSPSFKPPNGVGLSVDAGVVKGGGYLFFDFDKGEYAGALELTFSGIVSLKAIGIITTKMPDGSDGFSLLIIITAEFGTGIQLGFGFVLLGVGGLLGLNRTMRLQPLAEGVRTGGINGIMFPTDVVANAPRIISDLRNYFPPEEGKFLIGPMAKLGWGTPALITVSLGIIIEIPSNIAILGVLKVALPTADAPLIILQINFIGAIEFDKSRLWFFASLYDSRILFITLEGEMGLLVAWGSDANFVVSVGGFHPSFNPPPLPFGSIARLSLNILNEPFGRIRVMAYFAVTSNTVQFGAHAELFFGVSAFNIDGHIGFDALFQFSPFYFIIELSASLSVKVFGIGFFSVRVKMSLEGPTPYRAKGTGSISLFFFDIDVDFDFTWGESQNTTLPPIEVMPLLKAEFDKLENWKAQLPAGTSILVSLRKIDAAAELVLHPVGTLQVSQRYVPLDITLDKIGAQKPNDVKKFVLSPAGTSGLGKKGDVKESFAMAQFQEMTGANKLSRPSFEKEDGGLELSVTGQQVTTGKAVKRIVRYELIVIDTNFKRFTRTFFDFISGVLFLHFLKGNAVANSPLSFKTKKQYQPFEEKVAVKQVTYSVASVMNNKAYNAEAASFASEAQAREFIQQQAKTDPKLKDNLHIILQHELNTAA